MTVTVYKDKIEDVLKRLEAIKKKADKYGSSFSYEIGETYVAELDVMGFDPATSTTYRKDRVFVEAVDVRVDDEMIRKDGWTAVAKLEHLEGGNLVTVFDGTGYPAAWQTADAYCEHCKTNHKRTVTYMVRNDDGVIRQVGSSCLRDYTGIDPRLAVSFASLRQYIEEDAGVDPETYTEGTVSRLLNVEEVIALACKAVRKNGYVRSTDPGSTRDWVAAKYGREEIEREDEETAKKIVDWVLSGEHAPFSYEWECAPLVRGGWCKSAHIGRLVWLPVAWKKELERREKIAKRNAQNAAEAAVSKYVGNIGDRLSVDIAKADLLTSWESQWGVTFLYKFVDTSGNVLIWFSSGSRDIEGIKSLTGTVKAHNERDGIKQTVVTRCILKCEKLPVKHPEAGDAGFDLKWLDDLDEAV